MNRDRPFSSPRLAVGRLLMLGLLLFATTGARAAGKRVVLSKSVGTMHPNIAATRRALAAKDLAQNLNFSVALQLRNFPELQARVARGETFSRAELEVRYLPTAADYAAVKAWAVSQGLAVQQEDDNRLSVFLRGTVAQVQSSLAVSMVKVTFEGVDYPAADSSPSLPEEIAGAVVGVNGLRPYRRLHTHSKIRPQASSGVTYTVPEILTTYDATNLTVTNVAGQSTSLTGAGQTIAILIDATPLQSDLTAFYSANGIAASTINNITTINVNGYNIGSTEGEETLDVEWTSGVAPGAKIRVYATGDLEDASLDRGLARILADAAGDPTIHQLSISLGAGETYGSAAQFTTDGQYFAALASQGISTFVSAGDGGSTPDESGGETGPLQVEYYASDPSVTAVGGTRLSVDSTYAYDAKTVETVWGPYSTTNGATGGGTSIRFVRPGWQTGNTVPAGTMRLVPDVAMPADPYTGAYLYYNNSPTVIGGTSWSAPTWAGFCALLNQARGVKGSTGGIGLLNPSVYPLIGTANFHDITIGNNAGGANAGGNYAARAGYDECTGAGSPDLKVLINTLLASGTTAVVQPTISGIAPASGVVGSSVVITGTGFTKAQTCGFTSADRDAVATFTINSDTQITATVPPAAENGPLTVTLAGGTATSAASFTVTPTSSTPTLTGFTPTSGTDGYITYDANGNGTITNGTTVTLTGTNFTGATNVTIGGVSGDDYDTPFTVVSATQMTVLVPVDAVTGVIKVTTANGKATSASTFTVTPRSGVPVLTSFMPTSGPVGTSVTLAGTTFTGATGVSFGTIAAKSVTVSSSTKIIAVVPAGASTGAVVVTNTKGGSVNTNAFTVTTGTAPAPAITNFTPASGPVGTGVSLTGTGFTGATAVAFNGTAATAFSVASDTQITATVPTGATSGTISVTAPGGTATSSATFTVTTSGGNTGVNHLVISQVYGGGGSSGGPYLNDYVELYNPTGGAVDLSVYSVQYAKASGSGSYAVTGLNGSIAAGHYYLIQESAGTSNGGAALPMADATGTISLSSTAGRVALVSNTTAITSKTGAGVVDFVGYGSTASEYEGSGPAPTLTASMADLRAGNGATDTDNNSADFTMGSPNPRNSAMAVSTPAPDLMVSLTHTGNFTQADTGDTYTLTVANAGNAATSGTVSVSDTLPGGLTVTGLSGTGWTVAANGLSATRTDALAAGASYPALTLTVSVASTAPASVTNIATVSGGGETNTANDSANDVTTITALTPSQNWRYTYFGTTANSGNAADTANPSGDGLPNLVKYALGLDPTVPTANPVKVDVSTGYLRLTTPRNANATDVTMTVQVSGDLTNPANWTTKGTTIDQSAATMLQVSDATAVNSAAERFLRLTVTR